MTTILLFFAGLALGFRIAWASKPNGPAQWRAIDIDPTGKGPNVDPVHYEIETDEGPFRFTDHEKRRAKIRAPGTHDYR